MTEPLNPSYPSTRWLFQFQMLLQIGSFTEAAARMQMSQQALSKNIQALEQWAGYPLLNRQTPLSATPQGQQLLAALPDLLQSLQNIAALRPHPPNRLALGISSWLPFEMLIPALQAGLRQSQTQIQLISLPETDIQTFLQAGELDLGLTLQPLPSPGLELRAGHVLNWQWVAVPHLLTQAPPYPWLQPESLPAALKPNQAQLTQLRAIGQFPKWEMLKALVLQGIGISCLPVNWIQTELNSGQLQTFSQIFSQGPFSDEIKTPLYFSAMPAIHLHPLTQDWQQSIGL